MSRRPQTSDAGAQTLKHKNVSSTFMVESSQSTHRGPKAKPTTKSETPAMSSSLDAPNSSPRLWTPPEYAEELRATARVAMAAMMMVHHL